MRTRPLALASAALLAGLAGLAQAQVAPEPLLLGAIETHVHSEEDNSSLGGGSMDMIEMATRARDHGMRAIVVKPMFFETATRAYLATKAVPGIEVLGGLTLNTSVGGMNAAAVDALALLGLPNARMVWLANVDAEGSVAASDDPGRPAVRISENGALTPATVAVLDAVARHGFSFATSHASAEEALLLVREARARAIPVVVTHAAQAPTSMSVEQMREVAALGGFVEHTALGQFKGPQSHLPQEFYSEQPRVTVEDTARFIREVGAESAILATDLGQAYNPNPVDGLELFIVQLQELGITDQEIDLMVRRNPATLLGLAP